MSAIFSILLLAGFALVGVVLLAVLVVIVRSASQGR
jgi:hypothetical protein